MNQKHEKAADVLRRIVNGNFNDQHPLVHFSYEETKTEDQMAKDAETSIQEFRLKAEQK